MCRPELCAKSHTRPAGNAELFSHKNFCDLCDINGVVIFLRIPLSIVLLCDKVLRLDLILVELLADEDYVRFLESCCTVNKVRGQTGFFDLIAVTTGFGTADGECLFVLRSVEGQGKGCEFPYKSRVMAT